MKAPSFLTFMSIILLTTWMGCQNLSEDQSVILKGKVLNENGNPLEIAHIHVSALGRPKINNILKSQLIKSDGTFELELPADSSFLVYFSSPNRPTYVTFVRTQNLSSVGLQLTLGTFQYNSMNEVGLIGTMNDFEPRNKLFLEKLKNGNFQIEFDTELDTIEYQLTSLTNRYFVSGTEQNKKFTPDLHYLSDNYVGLAYPDNGKVKIDFKPGELAKGGVTAVVTFEDPLNEKIAHIFENMINRNNNKDYNNAFFNHLISRKGRNLFNYDWSEDLAEIEKLLNREEDSFARQLLLLSYADISTLYGRLDSKVAEQIFVEIDPKSELWSLNPKAMIRASSFLGGFSVYQSYILKAIEEHPSDNVKTSLLYNLTNFLYENGGEYSKYYEMLMDKYPDSPLSARAVKMYSKERVVKVGSKIPAFSFESVDSPEITVTDQKMLGKVYLIDFWATWCGPCIWEFPFMEKVYNKYANQGFEIITVSFDSSIERIQNFRTGKNKMPWLNAWERDGLNAESVTQFEISSIPKPILVSDEGIILAIGSELSGEEIDSHVAEALRLNNDSSK